MCTKLTLLNVRHSFDFLKQLAFKKYKVGEYATAWSVMQNAVSLIQEFNWEYTDDDLEQLLGQLSERWIPFIPQDYVGDANKVVVLDDWCTSYVLVLQYIDALITEGKEVLYITSKDVANDKYQSIIPRVSRHSNFSYRIVPSKTLPIDKWCNQIYNDVISFAPLKIVAHISSCSQFLPLIARLPQGLTTYRSNLDDQCFWLGRSVIDYCLEFRPFGATVSREKRKLREQQQLFVPFYPINDGHSFQGFPQLPKDSVVLFSGGDFYKTLDPDFTYWNLVKRVLKDNSKAVLLFATKNGLRSQQDFLASFIADNHLENQFFFIGFRPDINEVFAHSDIFLGTCPVCGSLMSQLAAINHKPILQYYLPDTDDDETEQALNYNNPNLQISFSDVDAFLAEATHLIQDPEYRKQKGEEAYHATIKPEQFNKVFIEAITANHSPCPTKKVNYEEVSRRWWWPEQMGFDDHLGYLEPMMKRYGLLSKMPSLWLKYNYRRFFKQKLFSFSWYKYKFHS